MRVRSRGPDLLPASSQTDRPLFVVVAILTALACAAGMGARATWSVTGAWTAELAGAATVQVRASAGLTSEAAALEAADIARSLPGVADARALPRREAEALLEPWFGPDGLPADVPLPGLVDVRFEATQPAQASDVAAALAARGLDVLVDDHSRWAGPLMRAASAARGLALVIVALLTAAAAAVISYAVRASLNARRDIVDVLHMAGAGDGFIAREFMDRFITLGLRAGLAGAVMAAFLAVLLMSATHASATAEEYFPSFRLAPWDVLILLTAPPAAAGVAALTARRTVLQALRQMLWR